MGKFTVLLMYYYYQVVLSSREPRTWYKSVVESIWLFNELARKSWTFRIMLKMFDPRKGSGQHFLA